MDRRASLSLLLGKRSKTTSQTTTTTLAPVTNTFNPYMGTWGYEQAAHLLRRTTFGPTYAQIKQAEADGLDATISMLFQDLPLPSPPVYYDFENDPVAALGESWVEHPETLGVALLRNARRRSLLGWSFLNIRNSGMNIIEKMTLFWHNHFVVASTNNPRFIYTYINTLRANALGNFKTLVEEMTIDPSMLIYLNGTQNNKNAPNENFARELLELFTIGKGDAAGPGDYTNYTEDDVVQIARALTGWKHFDLNELTLVKPAFIANRHDEGDKQLSPRFNDVVISNQGEDEYKAVIDIIFQQDEVARFICRKLYRWFVGANIDTDIEMNIIEPMSQMMIADNYDVRPALMALLSSEHFYDESIRGCMISHPLDFAFKMTNAFELELPVDFERQYAVMLNFFRKVEDLEMVLHNHPNVAGWKAFYQAPQFYKIWINAVSLPIRMELADRLIDGYNVQQFRVELNVLNFAASLDNPSNPNDLIHEIASILFAYPISQEQLVALKDVILQGLPDFEWEVEYSDYITGNASLEESIDNKLKALIGTMLKMPEFYLM